MGQCMRSLVLTVTLSTLVIRDVASRTGSVNRGDMKNGIAAHAWGSQHRIDWSSAKVRTVEQFLWNWKVLEAIHIQRETETSNLDCGLQLSPVWTPIINSKQ